MELTQVRYKIEQGVALVTMDRAQYKNAQSRRLLEELDIAFRAAAEDSDVRVIVLRGAGDDFSSGHDLGTPEEAADRERRPVGPGLRGRHQRSWELYVEFGLRWRDLPRPTIAAVQGYCIYGGWMIASSMDIVFADVDAKFLPAKFQYFSVPWDLGARKAKEVLFEGRFLSAEEARDLGFVNRVAQSGRLDDEVMAYARTVAERDPFDLRLTKLAVNQMEEIQGYNAHIKDAHTLYVLGTADPAWSPRLGAERRLREVQDALDREDTSGM